MVKTIFVGKINDREFDNIFDYNSALIEIQKKGENFTASSEMKTIEENECGCKCNGNCDCDNSTCQNEKKQVFYILPGFVKGTANSTYMDEYYEEEDYKKMLEEALANIENMSEKQLHTYAEKVTAILDKLEEDNEKTEEAITSVDSKIEAIEQEIDRLCEELDKLEEKYDVLEDTSAAINEYGEFYNTLADYIDNKLSIIERDKERCKDGGDGICNCCNCECNCECKCVEEQKEFNLGDFLSQETVDNILNTITEEWNNIFNKYNKR